MVAKICNIFPLFLFFLFVSFQLLVYLASHLDRWMVGGRVGWLSLSPRASQLVFLAVANQSAVVNDLCCVVLPAWLMLWSVSGVSQSVSVHIHQYVN